MIKMPLVNLELTKNHTERTFSMFSHQIWGYQKFELTLTKFDLWLTLDDNQNPNFDPTVKTGWNWCHCKEYWINFPTIAHGLKSNLKQLRYLKSYAKHVSLLLEAITFDPTVQFLKCRVLWKLYTNNFLVPLRSSWLEFRKASKLATKVKTKNKKKNKKK